VIKEGGKFKNNDDCTETAISATSPVTIIKCTGVSDNGGTQPRAPIGVG